jgi:hypothetical protein
MLNANSAFYKIFCIFILSLLGVGQANAETKLAAFVGGVRSDALWTDPNFFNLITQCRKESVCNDAAQNNQCVVATNECIANKMRAKGAGAQAIAFAQYAPVPSAIDKFKKYGKVAVVHARMQWADAADGFFLINDQGLVRPVADPKITSDGRYRAFLQRFPKAFIVGGPGDLHWPRVTSAANNSQQFIFTFPIVNGCMACARVGIAQIAYLFDHTGSFLGTRVVEITPISANTKTSST